MIETDDDFQGRNDAMQDQVEKEENQDDQVVKEGICF
jgi:hypothetical protein